MNKRTTFSCKHCINKCVISIVDCYIKPNKCLYDNEKVNWIEEKESVIIALIKQNKE